VELQEPIGKNNGYIKGEYYFDCQEGHGVLVKPDKVHYAEGAGAGVDGGDGGSMQQQEQVEQHREQQQQQFEQEKQQQQQHEQQQQQQGQEAQRRIQQQQQEQQQQQQQQEQQERDRQQQQEQAAADAATASAASDRQQQEQAAADVATASAAPTPEPMVAMDDEGEYDARTVAGQTKPVESQHSRSSSVASAASFTSEPTLQQQQQQQQQQAPPLPQATGDITRGGGKRSSVIFTADDIEGVVLRGWFMKAPEKRGKSKRRFLSLTFTTGTVRVFRQKFTLDDAIGTHACSLEANMRVTNWHSSRESTTALTGWQCKLYVETLQASQLKSNTLKRQR
jgi:hypothetical protein